MRRQLKKRLFPLAAISLLLLLSATIVPAQTSSFTYQGRVTDGGTAANGNYDLQFALFDVVSGGTQVGATQTVSGVLVSAGIFSVSLDFGAGAFPGAPRFLEIGARLSGTQSFTTLAPRQQITSTPYAIRSLNASSADVVTVGGVPGGSGNYIQNNPPSQQTGANFNISGNGTASGTLSGNFVNATTQYNIAGQKVFSIPGTDNTFAGVSAGANNTSGARNTAFGALAGASNQTGNVSAYFGYAAGQNDITGVNAFFGGRAGRANVSGGQNSFFGEDAGTGNVSGDNNAYFGQATGRFANGSGNSYFGEFAGASDLTGSFNTLIGHNAQGGPTNLTNAIAIGANAMVNQSNSMVLGSIAGVNLATASVNVGIGTMTPLAPLHVNGAALFTIPGSVREVSVGTPNGEAGLGIRNSSNRGDVRFDGQTLRLVAGVGAGPPPSANGLAIDTEGRVAIGQLSSSPTSIQVCLDFFNRLAFCSSSLRYKEHVAPFSRGLDLIRRLHPISFTWKNHGTRDLGLGAEDVAKVEPLLVTHNDKGEIQGVKYDQLNIVLINAIKQQQDQIATLQAENAALDKRLRSMEKIVRKAVSRRRR